MAWLNFYLLGKIMLVKLFIFHLVVRFVVIVMFFVVVVFFLWWICWLWNFISGDMRGMVSRLWMVGRLWVVWVMLFLWWV